MFDSVLYIVWVCFSSSSFYFAALVANKGVIYIGRSCVIRSTTMSKNIIFLLYVAFCPVTPVACIASGIQIFYHN